MIKTSIVLAVLNHLSQQCYRLVPVRVLYPTLICGYAVSSANLEYFSVRMYCETEERRSRLLTPECHLYLLEFNAANWE